MTAFFPMLTLDTAALRSIDSARFAAQRLKAASYRGSGLPRGYFCSVTPP